MENRKLREKKTNAGTGNQKERKRGTAVSLTLRRGGVT